MRLKKRNSASSSFFRPPLQSIVQLHAFVILRTERTKPKEGRKEGGEEANFLIEGFISINSVPRAEVARVEAEDN